MEGWHVRWELRVRCKRGDNKTALKMRCIELDRKLKSEIYEDILFGMVMGDQREEKQSTVNVDSKGIKALFLARRNLSEDMLLEMGLGEVKVINLRLQLERRKQSAVM